jgi:hypothetical protein
VEKRIAVLATRAHGVVCRSELLEVGVTLSEIYQRLRSGALIAVFRGVYRVGHQAPSLEARYLAAVKACGEGAVLSARAAAQLLGLLEGRAPDAEVTTRGERRVPGIVTRRCRRLHRRETTLWRGVAVTTPAGTLVDLAAVLDADELPRACHRAGVRHHTAPNHVEAILARRPNAPGAAKLRAVLRGDVKVIPQQTRECLPACWETSACRWAEHHLTVELDS